MANDNQQEALPSGDVAALPLGRSMRRRGAWLIVAMIAYFVFLTGVIYTERQTMLGLVGKLQSLHADEARLVALNSAVSRTVLVVNENYFAIDVGESAKVLVLEVEAVLPGLKRLRASGYDILDDNLVEMERLQKELVTGPSRSSSADLRGALHRLVIDLDAVTSDVSRRKSETVNRYEEVSNRVSLEWIVFGLIAVGFLGGLATLFFNRLAKDINAVQNRAREILKGYRGAPLVVDRDDELGSLIASINRMQDDLRQREDEVEISRQEHFHKEKMASIGSLAASVAHEINNPLSAIVGIAQAIDGECGSANCALHNVECHPRMILDQAQRVMHITRQISEFSVPQSQEAELLDLNGLLRSTANFVRFDRRFRLLEVDLVLDPNLPAVLAVADHLVQVAMNLLINAADALEGRTDPRPLIRVVTGTRDGWIYFEVMDNGSGIRPELLDRIFEERFTTKGPGRGSGLGLGLCRALVRKLDGDITITSVAGAGTTATVLLPEPLLGDNAMLEGAREA
ncbi:MAG: HAMP domain-containing protein [Betaproteobacteria bacterium]|nr:HAMP domain-containing protein [Betaproteobacteria bacterium]